MNGIFNQLYGGGISEIRKRYEESLAAPSQINVPAPKIETGEITELLDRIIQRYKPGGEFGKAELELLERARTKSLATTAQGMVSAGLAGTTAGVGAGRKWEEEVGMPARLQLEDIRTQRLMEAMGAKAGYMERAGAAETQFNLALEQMRLQERLQNREISLQEYLAEMERLSRRSISGSVVPSARTTPTITRGVTGGGVPTTGGYGADYGGVGAGYSAGMGGIPEGWQFDPYTGPQAGPGELMGTWTPPGGLLEERPETRTGYTNVGTPEHPSWVQSILVPGIIGAGARAAGGAIR